MSTTSKTTSSKLSSITKKKTIKPNGKVQGTPKDTIKSFGDANEAIEKGMQLFDKIQTKLDTLLGRASVQINKLREMEQERGGNMASIEKAVKDANDLEVFSARLKRYMGEVRNTQNTLEKRVAVLGVMVDLNHQIDVVEKSLTVGG